MVADGIESEVKLETGVGFAVPDLSEVAEHVTAVIVPERRLTSTYVDTPDLRLLRSGISLRHRHEVEAGAPDLDEWTLKLPLAPDGSMVVRREMRWAGPPEQLPAEVDRLVLAWRRNAALSPVARLVTVRQRTALRTAAGENVLEVDDDVVSVMDGPRLAARFRQLEVELGPAATGRLVKRVLRLLEAAGAHRGDDRPKVVRALGAPALAAPDVVATPLGRQASLAEVVRSVVTDAYLRMVRHDIGVRLDEDPEDVHQARVATRRLRSDLRFLRGSLDAEWVAAARTELGWLADALGAVRDADVLTERLRGEGAALPSQDGRALAELLCVLATERESARAELRAALESERYAALLDRLVAAANDPPMVAADAGGVGATADADASAVLPALVRRPWRHLRAEVRALGDEPSDDELHQVRIAAKRLRYACETATPICGRDAQALGRAAADLQTVLGDLHDAAVAAAWLRDTAMATPSVALVAGELVSRQSAEARTARSAWPAAWKRLSRKKMVAWLEP